MRAPANLLHIATTVALLIACGDRDPATVTDSPAKVVTSPPPGPSIRELRGPEQLSGGSAADQVTTPTTISLPDVTLTDQHARRVRLHSLLDDKIVVIQTIFTSCGAICPAMGTNFGKLQQLVADQKDVALLSISIDPTTDIPQRLAAWADRFAAGPAWTLLTGSSEDIGATLKALRVFTAEKQDHSSIVVIGHRASGTWTRVDGLSDPQILADAVQGVRRSIAASVAPTAPAAPNEVAHNYFTDVELVDQHGKKHRLYTDLLQGKVVVINSFFTSCKGICPPMTQRLADLQTLLGDRMGQDLRFLSLTVDPLVDTQARLAEYAGKYDASAGWLFLGGDQQNVDLALHKLGFAVEAREGHSNLFVIGNEATGLWKKAFSMAEPQQLLEVVRSVLDDAPRAG